MTTNNNKKSFSNYLILKQKIQFLLINFNASHVHIDQFQPLKSTHRKVNFYVHNCIYIVGKTTTNKCVEYFNLALY